MSRFSASYGIARSFPTAYPTAQALRSMIGGRRSPELALHEDDQLVMTALRGVSETMGIDAVPDVTFVKRWDRGIPNYRVGHLVNIDALFERLSAYF